MSKLSAIVIFFFLPVVSVTLFAQIREGAPEAVPILSLNRTQGLLPNYVYDLSMDSRGQLLLATYGSGILVHNGRDFKPLLPDSVSEFPIVRRLISWEDEVVFVSHNEVWQFKTGWHYPVKLFSGKFWVYLLKRLSNGQIIISNNEKSLLLSEGSNGIYNVLSEPFPFPLKEFLEVSDRLWVGIDFAGKIHKYDPFKGELTGTLEFEYSVEKAFLLEGRIVLYSNERIDFLKFDFEVDYSIPLVENQRFFSFLEEADRIWMVGPQGLYELKLHHFHKILTSPDVALSQITKIFKTGDETVWMATNREGLLKIYDQDIIQVTNNNESLGYITNLLEFPGDDSKTLVVTMSSIWLYSYGELREISLPEKPYFPNLEAGAISADGDFFLGGRRGFYKGNVIDLKFKRILIDEFLNTQILKIVPLENKNLLVGTLDGLFRLDSALNINQVYKSNSITPFNVSQISYFSDNLILFGNSAELFLWKDGEIQSFDPKKIDGEIISHVASSENEVWLGTSNGTAVLFDLRSQEVVRKMKTQTGKIVTTIGFGPDQRMLLATEIGPQLLFPDSTTLVFDERVQAYEVPFNSYRFMENGDFLLGTINGLFWIKNSYKPKLKSLPYLESIQINGQNFNKEGRNYSDSVSTLNLEARLNNLSFRINQVNYQNGPEIEYSFKLVGFSENWGPWQSSELVQFTNIPPGEYFLAVRVSFLDGQISELEFPLKIQIQPPFWKTKFGIGIMVLFSITVFYFLLRWFEKRNIRKNKKLARIVEIRTREIAEINHNLEEIVKSRTFDLERKNFELLKTIKEKKQFQSNEKIISSNTHDIVCLVDTVFRINLISRSIYEFLGIPFEQIEGKMLKEMLRNKEEMLRLENFLTFLGPDTLNSSLLIKLTHFISQEELIIEVVGKKVFFPNSEELSGFVLNLRNVTERENLKTELKTVYKNIYRDFHDEVGNKLARIIALISIAKLRLQQQEQIGTTIDKVETTAKDLFRDTRDFIWSLDESNNNLEELSVQILDFGEQLFAGSTISFKYYSSNLTPLPIKLNRVRDILLILKELMTNVLRHSMASKCSLYVRKQDNHILFLILDNGVGLSDINLVKGRGLKNIHFRAERLQGQVIYRNKGKGTLMGIRIPV